MYIKLWIHQLGTNLYRLGLNMNLNLKDHKIKVKCINFILWTTKVLWMYIF